MTRYYIFKKDNLTGKTIHICNGGHDDERECGTHWLSYMYGFMDAAYEILGYKNFTIATGTHARSFVLRVEGSKDVEYFMLLDQEGVDMIKEIS